MSTLIKVLSVFLIGCSFNISTAHATWAYMFVVNDGNLYVISETLVDPKQIDSKIGKVSKYSDQEGTYSGNFSNRYPKGTEYFAIIGVDIKEAIAVKEGEERFKKAIYQGEYKGSKYSWQDFLPYIVGIVMLIVVIYLIIKRR
ncbi:hypothetical protein [Paenibacillus sp. MBLB4367]|uniref:hypothetical protein n=1 Tax=Paenibacillus sp. MBLB4367 TaxID=3384767 RepID=UPI003907FFAB